MDDIEVAVSSVGEARIGPCDVEDCLERAQYLFEGQDVFRVLCPRHFDEVSGIGLPEDQTPEVN